MARPIAFVLLLELFRRAPDDGFRHTIGVSQNLLDLFTCDGTYFKAAILCVAQERRIVHRGDEGLA